MSKNKLRATTILTDGNEELRRRELWKASPAMAVADQLLGLSSPWRTSDEEEPSLADLFIASTYTEGRQFKGRARRMFEDILLRYRIDMRRARRFVLDDQFVEMVTVMAFASPEKTLARLQYATLPYEQTWIEFNLHTKMRTIHRVMKKPLHSFSEISPRLGCLLQRINDTDAVCTLIAEYEGKVMPHMTCYFFSITESTFTGRNANFYGCIPMTVAAAEGGRPGRLIEVSANTFAQAAAIDSVGKASLWGYTKDGTKEPFAKPTPENMRTPEFLLRHGDVGFSRAFPPYEQVLADEKGEGSATKLVLTELQEFTGQIRWIVTMLAMLNQVPVHADLVARSHQMRIGHFKKHQFVDYHKITLRLPKTNPVPYIERHIHGSPERRHRAHEVRAHWRTYLHAEHCGPEEHAWHYDYDNGYRLCGKCMAYSRLIHEHVRGNQELGWVRKDYVLKPAVR